MIVTIDGPAGAGKSTAARELARRLGFEYLDTGAMYRAVTLVCLRAGVDLSDQEIVADLARQTRIDFRAGRLIANDEDVSDEIRSLRVTEECRYVAANNDVRALLVDLQREIAGRRDIVTEGRDQGTVAFPTAECKFFLTADPLKRAERRKKELEESGETVDFELLVASIRERDERDRTREVGALRAAEDAEVVDTSAVDAATLVERLAERVRKKRG
jgi:CMP/dCMP kinase